MIITVKPVNNQSPSKFLVAVESYLEMEAHKILIMLLLRIILCAAISWAVYRWTSPIFAVLTIAAWGKLLAKPIIEAGATYFHWQKRQPYARWQGNYYEFANIQIRVIEVPDLSQTTSVRSSASTLWFCDKDVLKVVGKEPTSLLRALYSNADYRELPDENLAAFSESGVKKYLMTSTHHESKRMMMWIEREVIRPHRKRHEMTTQKPTPS